VCVCVCVCVCVYLHRRQVTRKEGLLRGLTLRLDARNSVVKGLAPM